MTRNIKEALEADIAMKAKLGSPALMERYVLAKGKNFPLSMIQPKVLTPNECYSNSYHMVEGLIEDIPSVRYVEGYIWCPDMPLFIHHAWMTDQTGCAYEVTIPLARVQDMGYQYYGIDWHLNDVADQMDRLGHYGILSGPIRQNVEMIFEDMPELEKTFEEVRAKSPFAL